MQTKRPLGVHNLGPAAHSIRGRASWLRWRRLLRRLPWDWHWQLQWRPSEKCPRRDCDSSGAASLLATLSARTGPERERVL